MGQLMPDDIDGDGKAVENALVWRQVFVPITVDHLLSIPEGVLVILVIVDG